MGNLRLLTMGLGTAVFHGEEYIAGNSSFLWALDGEVDALGHTGLPRLHCSNVYYMRFLSIPAVCMGKEAEVRSLVQSPRLYIWGLDGSQLHPVWMLTLEPSVFTMEDLER